LKVETRSDQHLFEVQIWLDELEPAAVRLELYADGLDGEVAVRHEMGTVRALAGAPGSYAYSGAVSDSRPASDYTVRALPRFENVQVPLECGEILWQR